MHFLWSTALKDLQRRRRDPIALIGWIGIPLIMTLMLQLVFGRGGAAPQGRLLVADEDNSLASRLLTGAFNQGQLAEMILVEKSDRQAGAARIRRGDGSALLIIPNGFGSALLRDEPARLTLLTNPAQTILPGIIEETLSILTEAGFYIQQVAGDELRAMAKGPPQGAGTFPDAVVAVFSARINRQVERLRAYLDPRLIELKTTAVESAGFQFGEAYFPGMLVLALMFIAQGFSADIWKERTQGAIRRAAATPQRLEAFLAGKALAVALVVAAIGAASLAAAHWGLAVRVSSPAGALAWITFGGSTLYLLMTLIQLFASTARAANLLSSLILFPLSMLGGSFFPFDLMPAQLAAIGRLTPNGWIIVQLRAMLGGSVEPARLAASFAGLLLVAAAAFFIAGRRLRSFL